MWTNRLDLATTPTQRALAGPGAFPNPDFLEVGYSPRMSKARSQTLTEQRAMFTMWAALPGPLILSADLRAGKGGLDSDVLSILMNTEVIAVNQDLRAAPIEPISNTAGAEVWKKPLTSGSAVVFFNRNNTGTAEGQPIYNSNDGSCLDWDMSNGAVQLKSDISLCWGSIGMCSCSTPPSPKIGLVKCNASDPTQKWMLDANTGEITNDAKHDLNSASPCDGEQTNNMLIYPTQGHANEKYTYQNGRIMCGNGCI